jgi:hypothetical protein
MPARWTTTCKKVHDWRVKARLHRIVDRTLGVGVLARALRFTQVAGTLVVLAGCAGYAPEASWVGRSADAITRALGPPTGRSVHADGTSRLEYARGPYGRHTYMIDFDAAARMVRFEQVLTEANFAAVQPGDSRAAVLQRLGRPSETRRVWRGAELWSYRYEAFFCRWFVVTLEPDGGAVRDAGYLPDPMCERGGDDDLWEIR